MTLRLWFFRAMYWPVGAGNKLQINRTVANAAGEIHFFVAPAG